MFSSFLILKPGAIGDLLLLTPVVRQLKKQYPQSRISIVVSSQATKMLFVNNHNIDKIYVYEKNGTHKSFFDFLKLCKEIKKDKYDIILHFQRSNLRLWLLTFLLPSKKFVVYKKNNAKHAVINYLETLFKIGISPDFNDINLDFFLDAESELFAENFFKNNQLKTERVVALNPGASHRVNRWHLGYFSELIDLLYAKGIKSLLIGGVEDIPLSVEILKNCQCNSVANATGILNLLQLGALLKNVKLLVTGDTGPMHIATAVGTKVIVLFGPADPKRTGPIGECHMVLQAKDVSCVPCKKRVCENKEYLKCMTELKPDYVFEKILEAI